jgi:hypothetical protein
MIVRLEGTRLSLSGWFFAGQLLASQLVAMKLSQARWLRSWPKVSSTDSVF